MSKADEQSGPALRFDGEGALAAYKDIVRRHPNWFVNPPGGIRILTEADEIRRAQRDVAESRAAAGQCTKDVRAGLLAVDPYMTILRDAVVFLDGGSGLHNRIVEQGSVAVLPVAQGRPVLLEIFRHGLRAFTLEFPRGGRQADESEEDAVRRELYEEIGSRVMGLEPLGRFTPGGSSLAVISGLFMAEIDGVGTPQRSEGIVQILTPSVSEVEAMIARGDIIDGFSLSLFARARARKLL